MQSLFIACFIAGVVLSVLSFASGIHRLHLPRFVRHSGKKHGTSMLNGAALTAFLTWFGGGGLLVERLTTLLYAIDILIAALAGIGGAIVINTVMNALARRESAAESLSMIGVIGRTVVPIREGQGTGEIVFTHAGTRRVAGARSESGRAPSPKERRSSSRATNAASRTSRRGTSSRRNDRGQSHNVGNRRRTCHRHPDAARIRRIDVSEGGAQ